MSRRRLVAEYYRNKRVGGVINALRSAYGTVGAFDDDIQLILDEWRRLDKTATKNALAVRLCRLRARLFRRAPKRVTKPSNAKRAQVASRAHAADGAVTGQQRRVLVLDEPTLDAVVDGAGTGGEGGDAGDNTVMSMAASSGASLGGGSLALMPIAHRGAESGPSMAAAVRGEPKRKAASGSSGSQSVAAAAHVAAAAPPIAAFPLADSRQEIMSAAGKRGRASRVEDGAVTSDDDTESDVLVVARSKRVRVNHGASGDGSGDRSSSSSCSSLFSSSASSSASSSSSGGSGAGGDKSPAELRAALAIAIPRVASLETEVTRLRQQQAARVQELAELEQQQDTRAQQLDVREQQLAVREQQQLQQQAAHAQQAAAREQQLAQQQAVHAQELAQQQAAQEAQVALLRTTVEALTAYINSLL